ncbi:MAG: hypothetical protein D6762_05955 [Candidatus Neomarinimicrobiota bacterium]|nr:MAG: hypothetical protein D6762_05955 [Candidatus Neomarinimicrobiota bacterium]
MKHLFLFDIDGTLLNPGPVPRASLNRAFGDITGREARFRLEDVAGFTDPSIVRRGLEKVGIDRDQGEMVTRILNRYLQRLEQEYDASPEAFVYSDAVALLARLEKKQAYLGLLTGNISRGARIKLGRFHLFHRFPLGVFGEDGMTRGDLPQVVRERAWDVFHESFRYEQMIIIGDTVEDGKLARDYGMPSLLVCRRQEWWEKMEALRPAWLGTSLDDPACWETIQRLEES